METNEEFEEIVHRRESEEVEDIESSSEIASEDEHKEEPTELDNSYVKNVDEIVQEKLSKREDEYSAAQSSSPKENIEAKSPNQSRTIHEPDKGLDIEGELDYEEEVQGKEDESEAENDDQDKEKEVEQTENKAPEKPDKEEGEEDDDEDDGELTDDDLEEGEVKDSSSTRKTQPKSICRFFHKGQCTWGLNCRFIHPGINDKGNYNMFGPPPKSTPTSIVPDQHSSYQPSHPEPEKFPALSPAPAVIRKEPTPPESAWERGLRHAKEIIKKSMKRKETETDFEDKRMNLSLVESEMQAEYEKDVEYDYYAHQSRQRAEIDQYYQQSAYDEAVMRDYDRRYGPVVGWHGAARPHENYELQWSRAAPEYDYREYRDRNRQYQAYERDNREKKETRERIEHRNQERWREERYSQQPQSNRPIRADEWRDPWRRSKTPKSSRRSRSKGRSRRSYSSGSSASYSSSRSSRSRSSSFSYSKSRSSSRSSRSRSYSYSPRRSKSRSPNARNRSHNRNVNIPDSIRKKETVPSNRNISTSNKNSKINTRSPISTGNQQKRKIRPPAAPPSSQNLPTRNRSNVSSRENKARSPSWSGSASSRSRSPSNRRYRSSRSHSLSRSLSRSLSISSVSSVSSSEQSFSGNESASRRQSSVSNRPKPKPVKEKPPVRERMRKPNVEDNTRIINKASKDPLKQSSGGKPQIKLTLLKPTSGRVVNIVNKRKTIDEMLAEKQKPERVGVSSKTMAGKKRPASSPVDSGASPAKISNNSSKSVSSTKSSNAPRRSTSSRREELLKQLRAVEDAIARKRTKF